MAIPVAIPEKWDNEQPYNSNGLIFTNTVDRTLTYGRATSNNLTVSN